MLASFSKQKVTPGEGLPSHFIPEWGGTPSDENHLTARWTAHSPSARPHLREPTPLLMVFHRQKMFRDQR